MSFWKLSRLLLFIISFSLDNLCLSCCSSNYKLIDKLHIAFFVMQMNISNINNSKLICYSDLETCNIFRKGCTDPFLTLCFRSSACLWLCSLKLRTLGTPGSFFPPWDCCPSLDFREDSQHTLPVKGWNTEMMFLMILNSS